MNCDRNVSSPISHGKIPSENLVRKNHPWLFIWLNEQGKYTLADCFRLFLFSQQWEWPPLREIFFNTFFKKADSRKTIRVRVMLVFNLSSYLTFRLGLGLELILTLILTLTNQSNNWRNYFVFVYVKCVTENSFSGYYSAITLTITLSVLHSVLTKQNKRQKSRLIQTLNFSSGNVCFAPTFVQYGGNRFFRRGWVTFSQNTPSR